MICQSLIEINIRWLRQAQWLLRRLNDDQYRLTPAGLEPHRAGAHLRHVLEFYQSFLHGAANGRIDYDARPRDASIERSRDAASAAIRSIVTSLGALKEDGPVQLRMEDAGDADGWMESSIARELQALASHTIHHFALIAMTVRAHGVDLDPDFGMAPSTLRYRQSREAEAA